MQALHNRGPRMSDHQRPGAETLAADAYILSDTMKEHAHA